MYYSTVVLLAIMVLVIENSDILLRRSKEQNQFVRNEYHSFLQAILIFYVSDALWGIIEQAKLSKLLFVDTSFYFIAMAGGIMCWAQCVVAYLNEKSRYGVYLVHVSRIFFAFITIAVAVNIFTPILFSVDSECVYKAHFIRYLSLVLQIILLIMISIHTFVAVKRRKNANRVRYIAIGVFGIIMAFFLFIQIWNPYLPLYTIAYMLGASLLHTFVLNDEKEEYKSELEKAVVREKLQYEELKNARNLAYRDALTGVKSKLAYAEYEAEKDKEIKKATIGAFAVAVFDINGLKHINDTYGHEKGDELIVEACMLICNHFKRSPVFRIGGDEFVALLETDDYLNRYELVSSFDRMMENPVNPKQPIIAIGMSEYAPDEDKSFNDVFVRADHLMYMRKRELKFSDKKLAKVNC